MSLFSHCENTEPSTEKDPDRLRAVCRRDVTEICPESGGHKLRGTGYNDPPRRRYPHPAVPEGPSQCTVSQHYRYRLHGCTYKRV